MWIVFFGAALATSAAAAGGVRNFDAEAVGRTPSGFHFHVGRHLSPARWVIRRDGTNGFLAHDADPRGQEGFALAILEGDHRGAVSISARLRLPPGRRSGGIVWRVQDAENYYLARLDLTKQDIGLYRIVQGNRVRIDGEDDLELDAAAWHTVKVVHEAENIRVYLGGIRVLRAKDRTFGKRGAAGVWCTVDSAAHFDDLRVDNGADDAGARRGR